MFAAGKPHLPGIGIRRIVPLGISVGAATVLLIFRFSPRPFFATIAVILWLTMLFGAAAFLQFREASASRRRAERVGWRTAAALYLVIAAILLADPLLGNGRLAMTLAGGLGIAGLARLTIGLGSEGGSRVWLYLSGSITVVIALTIAFGWPFPMVGPAIEALALDLIAFGAASILAGTGGARD